MPSACKTKVVKTAKFIESDSDNSNSSGDYWDKDKYVSTYFNIFLGFMINNLYRNTSKSEASKEEAVEYISSLVHVQSWIMYAAPQNLHQARRRSWKPPQ